MIELLIAIGVPFLAAAYVKLFIECRCGLSGEERGRIGNYHDEKCRICGKPIPVDFSIYDA